MKGEILLDFSRQKFQEKKYNKLGSEEESCHRVVRRRKDLHTALHCC